VPLTPGTRIAQYEVVARIGAGGMGEVYRAHDSRLGRDVALKVLPDHLADDAEMRARFEHEARAVAALSHPNIMAIHELVAVADRPVAVVELLDGESLRTALSRSPLPWREATQIGARVADGLSAAHAKGIVHRDLKPENIFLCRDGRPKILDFGLARSGSGFAGSISAATFAPTEPGRVLGTIGYMAPEQVRGEEVSPATDVFAFGCTLAEMLTAEKPFTRATPADSLAAVLNDPPPQLLASGREIPERLVDIVVHCLEKQPHARFTSAVDLAAALRSVLTEAPSGQAIVPRRKTRVRSLAVLPFAGCETDPGAEYLSDGITESIINSLSQLPKLRVVPRSTVFAYKGRDVNARSIGLALNVDVLVTGRVVQQGDQINIQAELVDVARETQLWGDQYRHPMAELLSLQEQIAWQISEALRMRLTGQEKKRLKKRPTGSSEAYQEYLKGRHAWSKWSVDGFRRAIAHFDAAIAMDPNYARAYAGLGDAYGVMGYYGFLPPEVAMTRAQAAAYKALELDPALAEAHATMGIARMFYYWDWIGAGQAVAKAIALDPGYSTAHMLQGLLSSILGRHDEAVKAARRGRDLDPLSMLMQMGVGWSLYFARRFEEALETFRGVTLVDPAFPEALNMIVGVYERTGQLDRAVESFGKTSRFFGVRASDEAEATLRAGLAASGPRGYWEARMALLREMERQVRDGTSERANMPLAAYLMAHAQLGERDEAFSVLEKMFAQRSSHAVFLQVDPCLDPLRSDPRFDDALRRMAFPAAP
jgi:eukaryotic-like serine/threonine-protein kinase